MPESKVSILIVDNDPAIRYSLCEIFRCLGHSVRVAEDGFYALQEVAATLPDILISDLNMPRMSGFELLSIVRRRFPSIYVIGMTGAVSGDSLPEGIAVDAFYQKASGLVALFQSVKMGIEAERASVWASRKSTPIWVTPSGDTASDRTQVILGCPECLRAFPQSSYANGSFQKACCTHCSTPINYAVVEQYVFAI